MAIKGALFVILLFALILNGGVVARAALAPIPPEYRDIAQALSARASETLYAIYVLQTGTAVATLVIGYPLFWGLGYESAFTLAMVAAILQFVSIIRLSLLVIPLALYQIAVGDVLGGFLVGVLGVILVGWFPDVFVRPRLAYHTAAFREASTLSGSLAGCSPLGRLESFSAR